ncbi:MAG: hypothetical protein RLZZ301_394 [Bacteroidota bacterium]
MVQGLDSTSSRPLKNVKVSLKGAQTVCYTLEDGTFELVLPKKLPDTLIFEAKGYRTDAIVLSKSDRFAALNVTLISGQLVREIVVNNAKAAHGISKLKTLHVEELTSAEFRKAACCNLSESFETNASVDVSLSDAVSGAKKIQLLGLDGVYTQLQLENVPYLRGLESSFGIQSVPGTWLESIQLTKGGGSVVNGYESMAGLVNLEFKKPAALSKLSLNFYQNRFGRSELNAHGGQTLSKNWKSGSFLHASGVYGRPDHNHDGFLDQAQGRNTALFQRFSYQGKKMEAQLAFQAYLDHKTGGQVSYHENPAAYGLLIDNKHFSAFAKTGFFGKKPGQSMGVIYALKWHELSGFYGQRAFGGLEKRASISAIYDDIIGNADHKFKVGTSLLVVQIGQWAAQPQGGALVGLSRTEWVPGVFAEYTYSGNRLSAVVGARYDQHNLIGGQFTPRAHLKYALSPQLDLRLSASKGWRLPNFVADNVGLLASSKTWIAPSQLRPEISYNLGGSLSQAFRFKKRSGAVTLDVYHTWFSQQLVIDRDSLTDAIVFKNLHERSRSTVLQLEANYAFLRGFEGRLAYKYLSVQSLYNGQLQQQVLVPRHRFLVNAAYQTRNKRWEYDLTGSVYGRMRLPQGGASNPWLNLNAQLTRNFKQFECYIGGENLLNYTQQQPIIAAAAPFSSAFDATQVWAPIMGWNAYFGLRYTLK